MDTQLTLNINETKEQGYQSRPATMDDLEATARTVDANFKYLTGRQAELLDIMRSEWQEPGFNLETDSQIVLTPQGRIAGYCEVLDELDPPVRMSLWLQIHPDFRSNGIGRQLLTWAEQRSMLALEKTPQALRIAMQSYVPGIDEATRQIFQECGFNVIRHSWTMVLEIEGEPQAPAWPASIRVKTMERNKDEENILRAVREAFKDHWGYIDTPYEEEKERWLHHIETDAGFDPSLCFLAMDGEEIAGISMCRWKAYDDPDMGWVSILGVRRPWRRRGVALALLQHTFCEFYARGRRKVGLGVDAQSLTGATRLYEKAGMRSDPSRQLVLYEKELRSGLETRTQALDVGGP